MAVTHDWECLAHGHFTARGSAEKPPKCPKGGCSKSFVRLVFLQAPGHVSARTRTSDRLVREMATMQSLSDISTSPSRPGGSVAHRNRMKMRGPKGREYPELAASQAVDIGKYLGAMTHKGNALAETGIGRPYVESEWKKDPETGKVKHLAGPSASVPIPVGTTGVSIERVKEGRRANPRSR